MTTLHEILYTIDTKQKVSVIVKYDEFTVSGKSGKNVIRQTTSRIVGYPPDLIDCIDSATLFKHLAQITGVEDGVIQVSSRPETKTDLI